MTVIFFKGTRIMYYTNNDGSHGSRVYQPDRDPIPHSTAAQTLDSGITFQESHTHPFQKLGGWLMFIVYAPLVGIGIILILLLISFNSIFPYIQYIGYLGPKLIITLLITLAGYGASCVFCVMFSIMLKNKDPRFLRFFELTFIVFCSVHVIIMALSGFDVFIQSINMIISNVLGCMFVMFYFRESIRVHIYMGNDAYLRNSIFSQNASALVLSGIKNFASLQTDSRYYSAGAKYTKAYTYQRDNRGTRQRPYTKR